MDATGRTSGSGSTAVHRRSQPVEIAEGVHQLRTGRGLLESNVHLVRHEQGWALVDTGRPGQHP